MLNVSEAIPWCLRIFQFTAISMIVKQEKLVEIPEATAVDKASWKPDQGFHITVKSFSAWLSNFWLPVNPVVIFPCLSMNYGN